MRSSSSYVLLLRWNDGSAAWISLVWEHCTFGVTTGQHLFYEETCVGQWVVGVKRTFFLRNLLSKWLLLFGYRKKICVQKPLWFYSVYFYSTLWFWIQNSIPHSSKYDSDIISTISNTYARKKESQAAPRCTKYAMHEHGDTVTCTTTPYGYTILSTTAPGTSHKATRFSWQLGQRREDLGGCHWDMFHSCPSCSLCMSLPEPLSATDCPLLSWKPFAGTPHEKRIRKPMYVHVMVLVTVESACKETILTTSDDCGFSVGHC